MYINTQNRDLFPEARWVSGFKIVPAADLTKENPTEHPAQLWSDDKEALDRVIALIQSTGYPIGKTGPLVGARDDEVALQKWALQNVGGMKVEANSTDPS